MFTILTQESGLFRRRRLTYCRAAGASYAVLPLGRRPNWSRVRRQLGDTAQRVLCGPGVRIPPGRGIREADTLRYSHRLTLNGLEALLEQNREAAARLTAGLVDPRGRWQGYGDLLLGYFRGLRVMTRSRELYQAYGDQAFGQLGAAVTVGPLPLEPADGAGIALWVAPEGAPVPGLAALGVIPELEGASSEAAVLSSFRAGTPEGLEPPAGVDSHAFQGALYQFCGMGRLGTLRPERLLWEGEPCSLEEGAGRLGERWRAMEAVGSPPVPRTFV